MSDNNIYQIDSWAPGIQYYKNKILTQNNLFYYAAQNYTSDATSINNDINNGNLGGYIYYNGTNKPYFTWKHSYKASNKNTPRVKTIVFGDGYAQRVPDGINTLLLNYTLTFEAREIHEITAILHFLTARNGTESFVWLPPAPRGQLSTVVCTDWTDVQDFYQNYSIQATFVQTPV